jgi:hypothetical protein
MKIMQDMKKVTIVDLSGDKKEPLRHGGDLNPKEVP